MMKTSIFLGLLVSVYMATTMVDAGSGEVKDPGDCECKKHWHKKGEKCVRYFHASKNSDDAEAECKKTKAHLASVKDIEDSIHKRGCKYEQDGAPVSSAQQQWKMAHIGMTLVRDSNGNPINATNRDGSDCTYMNPGKITNFKQGMYEWCSGGQLFAGSPAHPLIGPAYIDYNCVALVFNDACAGCWAAFPCSGSTFTQYVEGYWASYTRPNQTTKPSSNMVCSNPNYWHYQGQCHKISTTKFSNYADAKADAAKDGATLCTFESEDRFKFITGLLAVIQLKPQITPLFDLFWCGMSYIRDQTTGLVTSCSNDDGSPVVFGDPSQQGCYYGDYPHNDGNKTNSPAEPKDGATNTRMFLVKNDQCPCRMVAGPPTNVPAGYCSTMPAMCPSAGMTPDEDFVCH